MAIWKAKLNHTHLYAGTIFPPVCEELKSSKNRRFMAISNYPKELGKVTLSFWVLISSVAEWEHYKGRFSVSCGSQTSSNPMVSFRTNRIGICWYNVLSESRKKSFPTKLSPSYQPRAKPHEVGVGSSGRPLATSTSAAWAPVPNVKPALRFLFCTMILSRLHSTSGVSGLPRAAEVWGGVAPPSGYRIRHQRVQTGCLCSNKEQDETGQLPSQLPRIYGFTLASLAVQPHWKGKSF